MKNKDRLNEIISIIVSNDIVKDRSPKNIRKTLEDLGPTFIKIGQILSTRVDLIPSEYALELAKLRSEVTPIPYDKIISLLKESYGDDFSKFVDISEKPIGCASIAQVHTAKVKGLGKVVLKIKRPGIDDEIKNDIELLKDAVKILHLSHFIKIMDLEMVLDEIYKCTLKELDFEEEKKNMISFLDSNKTEKYITCPKVYSEFCLKNVVVMEYIEGIMVSNFDAIERAKYDKKLIVRELGNNYMKQALDDGLFHADPHPDNICLSKGKIVFLDWGMVGGINKKNRGLLSDCMKGIIYEDYDRVADDLVSMSSKRGDFSYDKLVKDVEDILSVFTSMELCDIDVKKFMSDIFNMLRSNNLVLDYDVTLLIRGICVIESVMKQLDPSTSLFEVLENRVKHDEIRSFVSKDNLKKISRDLVKSGNSLVSLPNRFDKLMRSVSNGDFKFKFELNDSSKHVDKIENLVHELILGFIDGCLILGYSLCSSRSIKCFFLIFIIVISAWLLLKMIFDLFHKGY